MTPIAGGVALNLALGCSVLTILALLVYNRTLDHRLFLLGQRLGLAISFFVFISTFILGYQLFTSNFDIDYVARYTSYETPNILKFQHCGLVNLVHYYFGYLFSLFLIL